MPMPGPPQTAPFNGPIVSGPYIDGSVSRGPVPFRGGPVAPPPGGFLNSGTTNPATGGGTYSGLPAQTTVPAGPPNVLGAGAVRPTGPSAGFDPQYLQNLATAIGGLFSRPGGNLNFNPLGNLSDIGSPSLGFGNAASPGLPPTLLQDAINGLAFLFNPPAPPAPAGGGSPVTGGGGPIGNRRGNQLV